MGRIELRVEEQVVVIEPPSIEVRRSTTVGPTPDDTVLALFNARAVRRLSLFLGVDGEHRLVLAIGTREGIDLGAEPTGALTMRRGREIARLLSASLEIETGNYLDEYFRESGPILSRIVLGKHFIEAELVDPVDPKDEVLSPWMSEVSNVSAVRAEISYERISIDDEEVSIDDLLIDVAGSADYDDGPFALPRVRTAPGVEAVYPMERSIDPPPMSSEAAEEVGRLHRPPRQLRADRPARFAWLRAALKGLAG
jgi:hypothetical protein